MRLMRVGDEINNETSNPNQRIHQGKEDVNAE